MRPCLGLIRWRILVAANDNDFRRYSMLLQSPRTSRTNSRLAVNPFKDLPEAEFINKFRLNKNLARSLIRHLTPLLAKQRRRNGISPGTKVLIALAFYATGSYQTLVAQSVFHYVSQPTVSRAVKQVTEAINTPQIFQEFINWPTDRQNRNIIKSKFYQSGIPGVLGCIGGTHVAILRPVDHEERFLNRIGYHSLNVMIICDSEMNIMCVDANNPGSTHDSIVWQSHPLNHHLMQLSDAGEQVFLLGDSRYPMSTTLMTPPLNTVEGTPEHNLYTLHVTTRKVVEQCIGVLKERFRCLLASNTLRYSPAMAAKIVNACCVLHNIANKNNVAFTPLTHEEAEMEYLRQNKVQHEIPYNASNLLDSNTPSSHVNTELQRAQALQQALVERLWRERNI